MKETIISHQSLMAIARCLLPIADCRLPIAPVALFFLCFLQPSQTRRMNKTVISQALLQLLVRVYNQSIQSYYFFPDVILCGRHRLEREEFEQLIAEGFITPYYTDSFGMLYRLTKKADGVLREQRFRKRYRPRRSAPVLQTNFSFC